MHTNPDIAQTVAVALLSGRTRIVLRGVIVISCAMMYSIVCAIAPRPQVHTLCMTPRPRCTPIALTTIDVHGTHTSIKPEARTHRSTHVGTLTSWCHIMVAALRPCAYAHAHMDNDSNVVPTCRAPWFMRACTHAVVVPCVWFIHIVTSADISSRASKQCAYAHAHEGDCMTHHVKFHVYRVTLLHGCARPSLRISFNTIR